MKLNTLIISVCATAVLASGCKKDDDTPSSSGGTGGGGGGSFTLASAPGTQFTLDGAVQNWTAGTTWEAVVGSHGTGTWSYSSGFYNSGTNVGLDVELGFVNTGGGPPSTAVFNSIFVTGTRNYVTSVNTTFGAEIRYYDGLGNVWSTSNGAQTGSAFSVTLVEAVTGSFDVDKTVVTFNCKLYPDGGGTPKVVTSGSARLNFENI